MTSVLPPPPPRPPGPAGVAPPLPLTRRRNPATPIGVGIAALGLMIGLAFIIPKVSTLPDDIDALARARTLEPAALEIVEPVGWTIYIEPSNLSLSGIRPSIVDVDSGEPVALRSGGSSSYGWGSRTGRAIARVDLDPGTYELRVEGAATLAIGDRPGARLWTAVWRGVVVGGTVMLAGIVLAVVSAIRDTRRRNERSEPPPPSPWSAGEWPADTGR